MLIQSLVLDLAAVAVIVLCAIYYMRKGFVAGLFSFFGTLIALVVSGVAANHLAPAIFNSFFRPGLEEAMTETISAQGILNVDQLLESIIGFLPSNIVGTITEALDTSLDFAAPNIASSVVNQVLEPLITPFIMVLLFFVLFSLVRVLVGVIRSLAVGVSKLPAMNTMNGLLGAAVGVGIACLYVYIALCVLWAYDSINPVNPVGSTYFSRSIIYNIFGNLNFFAKM